ncbi:lasso peptide biosynthesis B2 protein [Pantoea agglomerans]|uniref:lasso peptide biosynthesis B2 protein n=1 Tax=Enterobacter agglomerans TaxID=549 RepID=UPI00100965C5|nr:lasso peptide biosynthesis B2 protein [Pantoea agglomerans]QAV47583.1 lasso peptide biosynthesis B2 protein [Pantoea agglomerans]QAV52213.1 lasso peptide biosynthesis B2 protein [Pantoea agglomerans]
MSKYYFSEKVHHVNIENEITILDEGSDEYFLLSESQSSDLKLFMEEGILSSISSVLLERGVLNRYQGTSLKSPENSPLGAGMLNWTTHLRARAKCDLRYLAAVLKTLFWVNKNLKKKGLGFCLEHCRKIKDLKEPYFTSDEHDIAIANQIATLIRFVSPLMCFKVKCLEYSITLYIVLVTLRVRTELRIGFQRYDFLSHAWITVHNVVIQDDTDIENKLAVIIRV